MDETKGEILNIFIIGFHHKKGCQIEFSYPEIESLPDEWRNLPSLAMPDGAHNYEHDAVYFHLPSLHSKDHTIFGISCFQQIPIEKVKKRTMDMTRGTIQKAVCILSTLPLFGYIQIKMELVTAAFFDEGDFSNVSLLKDAFHHLNDCLTNCYSQHLLDGLSVRDLVLKFRHRTLLLFKLLLLERKVIFFHSPVKPLCCTLFSLISLHPGLMEKGLFHSFSIRKNCSSSNENLDQQETKNSKQMAENVYLQTRFDANNDPGDFRHLNENLIRSEKVAVTTSSPGDHRFNEDFKNICTAAEGSELTNKQSDQNYEDNLNEYFIEDYFDEIKTENLEIGCPNISDDLDLFATPGSSINHDSNYLKNLDLESFGLPLSIFTEGNLCLPYISISYLDFLTVPEIKGFHAGAANLLFKQKKQIIDVLVELETSKIETHCSELRRQLFLTTEDLRFGERLIRGVTDPGSCGLDSNNSEDWIRGQFTLYMVSLLRTSLLPDGSKELEDFNIQFINAWRNTNNYKLWLSGNHKALLEWSPGHPLAGNLSVSDMRLRFSQAMTNTESGRRINQAVASTGRAVGGAITQARGALTHWWNNLTTPEPKSSQAVNNI